MSWPTDDLSTTHFDAASDNPSVARFMLKRILDRVKTIIAARGATSGVCDLNSGGKVPNTRINRGVANGVASLDANAKVPRGQMHNATTANRGAVKVSNQTQLHNEMGAATPPGINDARVVTSYSLRGLSATTWRKGLAEFATDGETQASSSGARALSPSNLRAILKPPTITEFKEESADYDIKISWTAVTGASGYHVFALLQSWSEDLGFKSASTTSTTHTFADGNRQRGYAMVRAYFADGVVGPWSRPDVTLTHYTSPPSPSPSPGGP